ncbi:hypothetical protein J437_LFUL000700, partial [Ladona fulva]
MFSLNQTNNQVLFHLSQLTSAASPRRTPPLAVGRSKKRLQKSSQDTQNGVAKILCPESFNEALRNFADSPLRELSQHCLSLQLPTPASVILKDGSHNRSPWNISYSSFGSFAEDKREGYKGMYGSYSTSSRLHNFFHHLLSSHSIKHEISIRRGFKTERSIQAELTRNPSLLARFREVVHIQQPNIKDHRLSQNIPGRAEAIPEQTEKLK